VTKQHRSWPQSGELLLIVALNILPIGGVLFWDWRVFDIVFLYWIENLIIGAFSTLRMVARPYQHPLDLIFPALMAPFFVMHYGAFCWGHGLFVLSMFSEPGAPNLPMSTSVFNALSDNTMLFAMLALMALQAADWIRDTIRHGLGADGIRELMMAPYRRIVVLHLTILFGGFAVLSIGEPMAGLLLLIAIKTGSDLWHASRPTDSSDETPLTLTAEQLAKLQKDFPEPKVTVNGKEKIFDSFAAMCDSKEFRMMQSVLRMMGAKNEMKLMNNYLQMKIAEENATMTN
jgi:hypothetical protein